ncbi:MAG: 50S ribosomal protein L1 [Chloroflexota bacterium]
MPQHGKKYLAVAKLVEERPYAPDEAIALLKRTSYVTFDPTVEIHMNLGVDQRHADQQVRGVAALPAGTGKKQRVLVFAQGDKAREAEEAGADYVGSDDLVKRIEEGWLDFDVTIAHPDQMGKVGRLGRILGRRGLMPNPRTGTVSTDLARVIKEVRAGRVDFRVEKANLIHAPIGKVSFTDEQLRQNIGAFIDAIVKAKPTGAKGQYIKAIYLSSSMGPGIQLDLQPALALAAA